MPLLRNTGHVLTRDEWLDIQAACFELGSAIRDACAWVDGHAWLIETLRDSEIHSVRVDLLGPGTQLPLPV